MKTLKYLIATIFIALVFYSNTAKAEVKYNDKEEVHTNDKNCIATYGVARDLLWDKDKDAYLQITDLQNDLFVKYAFSKQLNTHVDVKKTLIKQSWSVEQLYNDIERFMSNI